MANIELARKALDHIEKYPDNHYQGTWCGGGYGDSFPVAVDNGDHPPCGTTLCMAGWVTFLEAPKGAKIIGGEAAVYLPDGGRQGMSSFAREKLGLDEEQAEAMFLHAHDLADLKAMVDQLEEDPGAGYDELRNVAINAWPV